MAEWPTLEDVKATLGIATPARDDVLEQARQAAIDQVVTDTYDPAPDDPTASQYSAAMVLATEVVKAPEAPYGIAAALDLGQLAVVATQPTYLRLIKGHRRTGTFGVA